MSGNFKVEWIDGGREPRCAPDPAFPSGKDVDITVACIDGWPTCKVDVPYPAKRCGAYLIECETCDCSVLVTTAGRPDDPRSVKIPCKKSDPWEVH